MAIIGYAQIILGDNKRRSLGEVHCDNNYGGECNKTKNGLRAKAAVPIERLSEKELLITTIAFLLAGLRPKARITGSL